MSLYVDIEKRYGTFQLKMKFESGDEVLSLLGASGCGKSLTLKCIAGIETPDRGRIVLDGKVLFDSEKRINLPPQKRKVGYLFQQYALFPNMTVYQNIAAGIRKKKKNSRNNKNNVEEKCGGYNKETVDHIVGQMLTSMGLEGMEGKYPHQLSGGQQQRAALARILVNEPDILLLDEPFSALDSHLRFRLEQQVRDIMHRFGKSVVLVSHNRDEVFRLTDKIAVIADGMLETIGDKHQVFREPQTKNGAVLTGCKNISPVKWLDDHHVLALDWNMTLQVDKPLKDVSHIGIRMKYIHAGNEGENTFRCKVIEVIENPFSYTVMLVNADNPGSIPIGWEMLKDTWESMKTEIVTISMPSSAILLLKE
ncbi:MAG: sulfate/molybdate ABC transporter ATP-binding protein [Eubacterium sp.]|nr:sulfate/molybdate ABC transporter ATP-binding protein [Eubacterium sp.]